MQQNEFNEFNRRVSAMIARMQPRLATIQKLLAMQEQEEFGDKLKDKVAEEVVKKLVEEGWKGEFGKGGLVIPAVKPQAASETMKCPETRNATLTGIGEHKENFFWHVYKSELNDWKNDMRAAAKKKADEQLAAKLAELMEIECDECKNEEHTGRDKECEFVLRRLGKVNHAYDDPVITIDDDGVEKYGNGIKEGSLSTDVITKCTATLKVKYECECKS